jgi:hypothetical protein
MDKLLNDINKKDKARIYIDVSAFCLSIWIYKSNVFNKQKGTNFLRVIRLTEH